MGRHSARNIGGQMPEELFYALGGWPSSKMVEHLNERFGTSLDPETSPLKRSIFTSNGLQRFSPFRKSQSSRVKSQPLRRYLWPLEECFPLSSSTLETIGFKRFFPSHSHVRTSQTRKAVPGHVSRSSPPDGRSAFRLSGARRQHLPVLKPQRQPEWTMSRWEGSSPDRSLEISKQDHRAAAIVAV